MKRFQKKLTNMSTVNGIPIYRTFLGKLVTKRNTPVYRNKNNKSVYSTYRQVRVPYNAMFNGKPVYQGNGGGYFTKNGKGLYKIKGVFKNHM